jgi:hypothetical protein
MLATKALLSTAEIAQQIEKFTFFLRLVAARLARGQRTRLENKIVSQLDTRCIYADAPE